MDGEMDIKEVKKKMLDKYSNEIFLIILINILIAYIYLVFTGVQDPSLMVIGALSGWFAGKYSKIVYKKYKKE